MEAESRPIPVRQRCVFYVAGFDPRGSGHYHALYRDEAREQERAGGLKLEVGRRRRLPGGNAAWQVEDGEGATWTHYEFMQWDDVVRAHWPRSQLHLFRDIFATTFRYLRSGALRAIFRLSWPPALALALPFALACAVLPGLPLVSATAGWLAWHAAGSLVAGFAAAMAAALLLAGLLAALERRFGMYWITRSHAFTARQAAGRTPALERRLDAQAARLAGRLLENADDEVLVVGHSSGAIMAASIVARALERLPPGAPHARLSLLTLGQCIPMLALVPQAAGFRRELALLGDWPALDWIDFSAPPDGCCFALVDPLASCGVKAAHENRPKLLSPRFAEMFDAPGYAARRKDRLRLHFQYIMASQRAVPYDYFAITAGPLALGDRFANVPGVVGYAGLRPWTLRPCG